MKYIIIIVVLFFTMSCSDLTSGKRFKDASLVLTGLLYEGQTINPENPIFIGRTIDVEGGNIFDLLIEDAIVKIINLTNPDTISLEFHIDFSKGKDVGKIGYIDPNWDNENGLTVLSGNRYRIEATALHNSEYVTVSAETTVPESIILNPTNDPSFTFDSQGEFPNLSYATANIEHPLRIQTFSQEPIDLFFRYYCLESFENAHYIIEFPGIGDTPEDEEEYEHPVNGMPRKMQFWYTYLPALDDDTGNFYITDRGYKASFIFYGRYRIEIYSIDTNYYHYLYKTNGYMNGGIENGYGYFGSASGGKIYTKVVE
jgi:hypothetical protein